MAARTPGLDEEIRDLYHGPLAEFVAARGALAKRLKLANDPRLGEVKELGKPSLSAWAVNQLFAHEARAMAAFLGAGERLRAAQKRAGGGGDAQALRQDIAAVRAETERLAARGTELLAAAERAPGEAIVGRLRTNIEALALDPATAPLGARGWLDEDLEPPGFEVMAALQIAAAGARPVLITPEAPAGKGRPRAEPAPPAEAPPRKGATVHQLEDGRRAAAARQEREARERRERIEQAKVELARVEAAAAAAKEAAERARVESDQATREATEAERRSLAAREGASEARRQSAQAEAAAARAREALSRAERS